jgi:hypothetical protein
MTFTDRNSFIGRSFINVNFGISGSTSQKFTTGRKFGLGDFFLRSSFLLHRLEIRIVID